jgi:hypothetical protein
MMKHLKTAHGYSANVESGYAADVAHQISDKSLILIPAQIAMISTGVVESVMIAD